MHAQAFSSYMEIHPSGSGRKPRLQEEDFLAGEVFPGLWALPGWWNLWSPFRGWAWKGEGLRLAQGNVQTPVSAPLMLYCFCLFD